MSTYCYSQFKTYKKKKLKRKIIVQKTWGHKCRRNDAIEYFNLKTNFQWKIIWAKDIQLGDRRLGNRVLRGLKVFYQSLSINFQEKYVLLLWVTWWSPPSCNCLSSQIGHPSASWHCNSRRHKTFVVPILKHVEWCTLEETSKNLTELCPVRKLELESLTPHHHGEKKSWIMLRLWKIKDKKTKKKCQDWLNPG